MRGGRPFTASGFVFGSGVAESRTAGPVVAASVRLPRRLFESGNQLFRAVRSERESLRLSAALLDAEGPVAPTTLLEPDLMTSSACHAHLRNCYMKIQCARIAMKLDTDVAETLCVLKTTMILKSSSVLIAYDDVFAYGANIF